MSDTKHNGSHSLRERINAEMEDSFDEELEMELDDERLDKLLADIAEHPDRETIDRRVYFKELFRLQRELVKLQDWVAAPEAQGGGDLRGPRLRRQGRRDQAHHAAAQSARLPRRGAAGAERARAHAMVFPALRARICPAGGEIVLFDRSWYNRAGVERVMGFCTDERVRGILPLRARIRADAGALRHHPDQVLVLDHRRGAAVPLHDAHPRSAQAVEAEPDGRGVARAAGSTTPRPRRRCWSAPTSRRRRGGSSRRSTRSGRGSTASATC